MGKTGYQKEYKKNMTHKQKQKDYQKKYRENMSDEQNQKKKIIKKNIEKT